MCLCALGNIKAAIMEGNKVAVSAANTTLTVGSRRC